LQERRISRRYALRYSIERKFALDPMCSRPQSALCNAAHLRPSSFAPIVLALGAFLVCPLLSRGQQAPPGAIGRVEGNDVSVDNGTTVDNAPAAAATRGSPSFVFNGSVMTVHDGKARLALVAGGQVDICGPAKFTLLQSGASITLALNFGRIHLQLPASTPLRIFTPTMIATPLDIGGASRDITAGLDMNDSLCVVATNGAIRLEQQFTGAGLIVPQSGEFFLSAGNLVPVAGAPGGCDCTPMHVQSLPPPQIPVLGVTSPNQLNTEQYPSEAAPAPAPTPAPPIAVAEKEPAPEPNVQLRILAGANQTHPIMPAPKDRFFRCRSTRLFCRRWCIRLPHRPRRRKIRRLRRFCWCEPCTWSRIINSQDMWKHRIWKRWRRRVAHRRESKGRAMRIHLEAKRKDFGRD